MTRVHVLVEGQTEETFVRDLLAPHLASLGVHLTPIVAATKRAKSGLKWKGGINSYHQVRRDLRLLLGDRGARAVTTMIDYYGLPEDFPGFASLPRRGSCYERVAFLEEAFAADLGRDRLIPYLSLHEFEALLLAAPHEIQTAFPDHPIADRLQFDSPEEVNDGADTHPAARLVQLVPAYKKPLYGPLIAKRIGLLVLRQRCPHFDGWVNRLEQIGRRT